MSDKDQDIERLIEENAELKRKLAAYEAMPVELWVEPENLPVKDLGLNIFVNCDGGDGCTVALIRKPTSTEHLDALLQQAREEEREKIKGVAFNALFAAESAFITQVGTDYNDIIHDAYLQCKSAIEAIRKGDK